MAFSRSTLSLLTCALLTLQSAAVPQAPAPAAAPGPAGQKPPPPQCRCYPTDPCWPGPKQWNALNNTVGGRLIGTIPLARPCHDPYYNAAECTYLQNNWLQPQTHYVSSSSVMAPFFANQSCDPFDGETARCVIGTYVQYAVDVTCVSDVQAAINFANQNNIRLVVRNTGHDYLGKSTGAGALGVWTHNLKDMQILDWSDQYYTGKALKMGAGVQGFEAYQFTHNAGLVVVGGECPTVGLAGGYTQGGGHSALASKYGLAADQTLEIEVVDGQGNHYIANRQQNSDLYWALSGGGGGTYGVVVSMTVKAHPDMPTSGFNLTFTNEGVSQDTYYQAVSAYHSLLPSIVDAGVMSVWYFTNSSFAISPLTGPGVSSAQMSQLVAPFLATLKNLGIQYESGVYQFPTYLDEFNNMFSAIEVGIAQYGGRLIPRSVVQNNNDALTEAYREINDLGGQFIGVGVNVSTAVAGNVNNAVLPAWRTTLIDTVITTPWSFSAPWSDMIANQQLMTNVLLPKLQNLTPGSGSYLNEADFNDPNWKQNFYGSNYNTLLSIKNKYDPNHLFYATTAVGSDYWQYNSVTGKLCRAS